MVHVSYWKALWIKAREDYHQEILANAILLEKIKHLEQQLAEREATLLELSNTVDALTKRCLDQEKG